MYVDTTASIDTPSAVPCPWDSGSTVCHSSGTPESVVPLGSSPWCVVYSLSGEISVNVPTRAVFEILLTLGSALGTLALYIGIGAVLMQTEESKPPHVIAYASRLLTPAESKYSVTHFEALAVVCSLKHFRDIIFAYPITVYTDHTAVSQLFHGKNLTGRLARLYLTIQQFEPTFKYLPGKANTVADALSRKIPVSAVNEIANFSLSKLHIAQRQDPIIV